jgi:restriction system protein
MADTPLVPSYVELLWPTVEAIRAIGGSGSIDEIVEKVVELEGFTEEQQSVLHGDGPRSQIEYRLAWSRTYLKGMGLLDNSARGVWTLTDKARHPSLDKDTVLRLHAQYAAQLRAEQRARRKADRDRAPADVGEADQDGARDWKEELLDVCSRCLRSDLSGWLNGSCVRLASSARPSWVAAVTAASTA